MRRLTDQSRVVLCAVERPGGGVERDEREGAEKKQERAGSSKLEAIPPSQLLSSLLSVKSVQRGGVKKYAKSESLETRSRLCYPDTWPGPQTPFKFRS